jgi:hypothetical protein
MVVVKAPPTYCHLMVLIGVASELEWRSILKMKLTLKLDSGIHGLIMPFHLFESHVPWLLELLVTVTSPRSYMLLMLV